MVDVKRITPDFSVSGQITSADVADLAAQGFKALICNRPDGEQPGQPEFDTIAEAARSAGLQVAYVPFTSGRMTENDVEAFRSALAKLPTPVLAYCRSGARSLQVFTTAGS